MTELRVGIVGLGVGESHIAGYESDPRCRVVALCDIDGEKLAAVGVRHPGRRLTTDPLSVLEDPDIDVVSIASYDDAHHSQVMRALATGKHVFVEKPLCLHDAEFEDICEALRRAPALQLSSNLILRQAPRFQRLRERVRAGELGRLYYVEGDYNYGRIEKIVRGWRGARPFYSVTHGGAIHVIDLLLWLTGERPRRVIATGNRLATEGTNFRFNDMIAALLEFPSGMIGKVSANFACVLPHGHAVALYGTEATFVQNALGAAMFHSRDPAHMGEPANEPAKSVSKGDLVPSFVRAILDRERPEVSANDVLDAMAVSLAIERSVRERGAATIEYAPPLAMSIVE